MFSDLIPPQLQKHLVHRWTIPAAHCGRVDRAVAYTDSRLLYFKHSLSSDIHRLSRSKKNK